MLTCGFHFIKAILKAAKIRDLSFNLIPWVPKGSPIFVGFIETNFFNQYYDPKPELYCHYIYENIRTQVIHVHITEKSETDYDSLQKWNKHLPLGKKTGNPFEDLEQSFSETFGGQVGLFKVRSEMFPDIIFIPRSPYASSLEDLSVGKGYAARFVQFDELCCVHCPCITNIYFLVFDSVLHYWQYSAVLDGELQKIL